MVGLVTDLATSPVAPSTESDVRPESKGERTRRRLLEIAVQKFGSRGFRNTSVSEIAREAGLTQAAAYAYFENKQALFVAAVNDDATRLIQSAQAGADDAPINLFVPSLIICLVAGLPEHPLAHRVLAGQEPEAITHLIELPALDEFVDSMERRIDDAREAGLVRADIDPGEVAAGIQAMVVSLVMSTIQTGGVTQRSQLGVVAAFEAMLRPPA